jgi:hypothetical protein
VSLENVPWFSEIAVESALVVVLLYRRIWRSLPVFCAYCVWDILSNLGVLLIDNFYHARLFQAFFAETLIDSVFQFCILVELTWSLLRPLRSSLPKSALLVVGVLILLVGAAIWPFAAFSGLAHVTSKSGLLLTQFQHTVTILRIVFFLLLAAGSQLLSISWRDRELQVATGLGFYSLVYLAVSFVQEHQSSGEQYLRLQLLTVVAFVCSLLYWVVSFMQKEAERREFTPQMQSMLLSVAGAARSTRVAMEDSRADKSRKQNHR